MYLMYCTSVNAGNRSVEWNAFDGPAITKIDYQSIITMNSYQKTDLTLKSLN